MLIYNYKVLNTPLYLIPPQGCSPFSPPSTSHAVYIHMFTWIHTHALLPSHKAVMFPLLRALPGQDEWALCAFVDGGCSWLPPHGEAAWSGPERVGHHCVNAALLPAVCTLLQVYYLFSSLCTTDQVINRLRSVFKMEVG